MAKTYYSNVLGGYNWLMREKAQAESGGTQTQASLCSLSPIRGHTELTFPQQGKWNNMCDVSAQGIRLETQFSSFFIGV